MKDIINVKEEMKGINNVKEEMKDINNEKEEMKDRNNEKKEMKDINNERIEKEEALISFIEKNNFYDECIIYFNKDIMYGITFLGRILITLYSFNGLLFLYNIIFQFLTFIPLHFYHIENNWFKAFICIIYISFSLLFSNIMVIPTFEFLSFPFLYFNNPLSHFYSFYYIIYDEQFDVTESIGKNSNKTNFFLIVIEVLYFIGFLLAILSSTTSLLDNINFLLLCLIYLYYLTMFLCYLFICLCFCLYGIFDYKDLSKKKKIPNINLLSYSINPNFKENYEKNIDFEDKFWDLKNMLRVILFDIFFLIICVDKHKELKEKLIQIFFLIIFFIVLFPISSVLNFPFCYRNEKIINFKHFFISNNKLKEEAKLKHPKVISTIRLLSDIIFGSISFILCIALFIKNQNNDDFTDFENLSIIFANKTTKNNNLLPNICNSYIYNIPLYLYIPFINDAYYYNETDNMSSFNYSDYRKIFFNDKEYEIKPIKNLVFHDNNETVKMIQYDVINKNKNFNLTILSIKGTTLKKDIFLDLQLYMPSVFLHLLSILSIFGNDLESNSFKLLEYSLSIPYKFLSDSFFIDNYVEDLKWAYEKYYNNTNKFSNNTVIVGHSLGGGLSKILGKIEKEQAISLSGPGINAFHSRWTETGNSENFDISLID